MRKPSSVSRRISSRARAGLAERPLVEQQAGRAPRAAPDAAAQLMQLREAETLGVLDHHDRRLRHVDADLDDGGRDQHLGLAALEALHRRVLLRPLHAAVDEADARRRKPPAAPRRALRPPRRRSPRSPRPAGKPSRRARRRRAPGRSPATTSSSRSSGIARVSIGVRPGGFSSSTETSMSPK